MLVLQRRPGRAVRIGDDVVVQVLSIDRGEVKLGFVAPATTRILRDELIGNDRKTPTSGPKWVFAMRAASEQSHEVTEEEAMRYVAQCIRETHPHWDDAVVLANAWGKFKGATTPQELRLAVDVIKAFTDYTLQITKRAASG